MTVALMLIRGILAGRWSLEDLDRPSPLWRGNQAGMDRISALTGRPALRHRNLAREWIEAHPIEWKALLADALAREPAAASVARSQPQRSA